MTDDERALVRAGVQAASAEMFAGLHSEDDHGFDLAKWLEQNVERITAETCDKIDVGRAMLVD